MAEKKLAARLRALRAKSEVIRKALEALEDEIDEISILADKAEAASVGSAAVVAKPGKNPAWFQSDLIHMNERGRRHIFSLFDQDFTAGEAARALGISPASATRHRKDWKAEQRK